MFLETSLGTVASVVVVPWTAIVDSPCIGVDTFGASITGGCMVCGAGDATVGVMGISATSSMDGRQLDLSLFTALLSHWVPYLWVSLSVNPGALRATGACMTGGRVGDRTGVNRHSGKLSG